MPVLVAERSNHGLCPVPLGHNMILLFVDAVIHGVHVSFHSFRLYTQAIVSGSCNYMFFWSSLVVSVFGAPDLSPHLWLPVAGYPPGVHSGRQALPQLPARHLSCLLCHLRPHRTVCPGQRGGGSADEAPGGEQQGGQGGC